MSGMISVIIVDFNSGEMLHKCLQHLKEQSYKNFEVIIVNNGASNYTAADFKSLGLDLRLKLPSENLGFAAGNNLAVQQAKGDWLAFLNPDAYAASNWLEELVAGVERYPDVDAFGSTQINALNGMQLDGAGDVYHILGIAYRGYFGRHIAELPEEGEVFAACGAAAFYKAKTFRELGGFEDRFFCYGEDVDLGYRLRLRGGRTVQLKDAVVRHEGSGISGRHSDFTIYHGHRNRIWLAYKNTPFWLYWPFLPLHILANLYLLIRTPFTGITKPYIKALIHGYGGLPAFKADRQVLQKNRSVSYAQLSRAVEWSPYKISTRKGKNWPYKQPHKQNE